MVRSVGIAAVVVGLAWTGLSFAQPSSPGAPSASASPARYITLREEGRPPQRCKLLKTWREPNGAPAFQVQAVDNGELMTIVGSAPGGAGEQGSRAMSTRIFHWGPGNKPPAGAPLPPSASAASKPAPAATSQVRVPNPPPPAQTTIVPYPAPAPVASQPTAPSRPTTDSRVTTTPPATTTTPTTPMTPTTATPTAQRKPAPALADSAPFLPQPPTTTTTEPSKPAIVFVTPQPKEEPKNVTVVTPPGTKPAATPQTARPPQIVDRATVAPSQPRLVPAAAGTVVCQGPCNSCCQPSCGPCCSSCNSCCQSSCVCCPSPPSRQSWISRLFNSSSPCCPPPPTAVAVKPATPTPTPQTVAAKPKPVAKVATEPARPRDWRESWGKVEPWKDTPKADASKPADVPAKRVTQTAVQSDPAKHLARTPVKMDAPKQPDPLKDPAWFGDNALKQKLTNSKIPDDKAAPPSRAIEKKIVVQNVPAPPVQPTPPAAVPAPMPAVTAKQPPAPAPAAEMTVLPPTRSSGQPVQVPADEPNAFYTAETPPKQDEQQPARKFNAFDLEDENPPPPQKGAPAMAGGPQGMMPMGAPARGPMPMPMPPRPPMMPPMMPDTGVPSAMANAFTLAGTRRPIPADFGGTPQEPNGFGNADSFMDLQGGPPRPYVVPRGMMPPPYPGMQRPMAVNPLMSVPPTPVASNRPSAPSETTGVPQLLATLKDSMYPSQRETAVEQLRELNWRVQPRVVESLTKSARDDPAATVRAACVHALGYMKVNTPDVAALVQVLKNDRDARVRHEAEQALDALGVAPAVRQDSGIQQASHK